MTHKQAIEAYKTIERLSTQPLPVKGAYALHRLKRRLTPEWEFQLQRENRLLDELKPESVEGTNVRFKTPEDAATWRAQMAELDEMELDYDIEPVRVNLGEDARITLEDIDMLDGFVIFEEG